jgi:hypothetical protein
MCFTYGSRCSANGGLAFIVNVPCYLVEASWGQSLTISCNNMAPAGLRIVLQHDGLQSTPHSTSY